MEQEIPVATPNTAWVKRVEYLATRDGWECRYCGKRLALDGPNRATIDEVIPRARGGRRVRENQVLACAPCNVRKGDKLWVPDGWVPPADSSHLRVTSPHLRVAEPLRAPRKEVMQPKRPYTTKLVSGEGEYPVLIRVKRYEDPMHEDVAVVTHWVEGEPWPLHPTKADIEERNRVNAASNTRRDPRPR